MKSLLPEELEQLVKDEDSDLVKYTISADKPKAD